MQRSAVVPRTRPSKVELRRARVRRDLAHGAVALMTENGFEATTVEEIARAADYHPSSFFRYFSSKEDAVFIGIPEATAELSAACAAIKAGDDAWTLVRAAAVEAVKHFTESDPGFFADQFALWLAEPSLQAPLAAHFIAWEQIITQAFTVAGGLERPDLYTFVVGGAIVSIMRACVHAHDLDDGSFADRVDRACLMLEQGLAHPPA
ncbi:MAG TPA: TetR/AcrR family transcriptional regulator [Pseudonocardia sp.]|jgi:AcrR family transcriptional regulator|nr:TetR/AcrR family transcriptional regulator [Pseudonocardia sp.]